MEIQHLINSLLHRRTQSDPNLAESIEHLDYAVGGLDTAIIQLTVAIEELIQVTDRPQGMVATAKSTMDDAVKMLDKMKYLSAPNEGVKASDTQPSATNRITPLIPKDIGRTVSLKTKKADHDNS
jgi:hypothetical protein